MSAKALKKLNDSQPYNDKGKTICRTSGQLCQNQTMGKNSIQTVYSYLFKPKNIDDRT